MTLAYPTYATNKTYKVHRHDYRLMLQGGMVVLVCDCGSLLSAAEIENLANDVLNRFG